MRIDYTVINTSNGAICSHNHANADEAMAEAKKLNVGRGDHETDSIEAIPGHYTGDREGHHQFQAVRVEMEGARILRKTSLGGGF